MTSTEDAGSGAEAPGDLRAALPHGLGTIAFGRAHEHHEMLGSTNDRALAWAHEGAPHGALVTAERQMQGRGRFGRVWGSDEVGDLYASLVLRDVAPDRLPALGLVVGLGLRDAFAALGYDVRLKWPNDLVARVEDLGEEGHPWRKVGGVLCEARQQHGRAIVVVGWGVNVTRRSFSASWNATSLALAFEPPTPALDALLRAQLVALERTWLAYAATGFAGFRERYAQACVTLGRTVWFRTPGASGSSGASGSPGSGAASWPEASSAVAQAVAISDEGALLVQRPGEEALHRLDAGEVSLSPRSVDP